MTSQIFSGTTISLKNSQEAFNSLKGLLGFASVIMVPIAIIGILKGDWDAIWLLALLIAGLAGVEWLRRITPADHVILHADRIELLALGSRRSVVNWSDVIAIHWPTGRDARIPIGIVVGGEERTASRTIRVGLQEISHHDRLTLIRYLRAAANVDQKGWSKFCYKRAIPLAEACQGIRDTDIDGMETAGCQSSPDSLMRGYCNLFKRRPFLAGLLVPLCAPRFLSRKMWWTLSIHLAVSALINIRLVWGQWASPFTEMILGVSAACLVLGCLAPSRAFLSRKGEVPVSGVHFWLGLALTVVPFIGNAGVKAWIPLAIAKYVVLAGFFMLQTPIFIHLLKLKARERREGPRLEAEALRRWTVYETTGQLPDADPAGSAVRVAG